MKGIPVVLVLPVVLGLVQATKSPDRSGWEKRATAFVKWPSGPPDNSQLLRTSLYETKLSARGGAQHFFRRMFHKATERISRLFSRKTQEQEALKKDAIRSYTSHNREFVKGVATCIGFPEKAALQGKDYKLCEGLPERSKSLCRHLATWTHLQLLEVERRCQPGLAAAECLTEFKLPLTHPLITQRRSHPEGSSPYVIRKVVVNAAAQEQFKSHTDTVQRTSEFLSFIISDASTIQLLAIEELNKYTWKKQARYRTARDEQSLLHSLRYYLLKALQEPPAVDVMLLRILWSMTTKKCAKLARRHIVLRYQGLNIRVTVQEILIVFWSDLIYDATRSTDDDCSKDPESNCVVVETYLRYKKSVLPQLQEAALKENFITIALHSIIHSPKHEQVEALTSVADKCSRLAALDVIYGYQASKVKFGKIIDFIGRHSWTRKLLLSLVRKSIRQMMHGHYPTASMPTLKAAPPRCSEHIVGAALYYGFTSGSKTWVLTGNRGVGQVVAFVIREEVLKMWTGTHPRAHSAAVSKTASRSFIQQSSQHARFSSWRATPRELSAASALQGYLRHAGVSMGSPLELVLLQRKWSPTKRRLVFGGAGLALVLLAAGGLSAGSLVSFFFPLLFLFAGIAMCVYSVISTLKSQGLLFATSSSADENSVEEEEG